MHLAVGALLILAVANPLKAYQLPATGSGKLAKEFQDIVDIIPVPEILEITRVYASRDVEFKAMLRLVSSDETKQLIRYVENAPELKEVLDYVHNHGLDIYFLVNKLNEAFDLDPYVPLALSNRKIAGGVQGYVQDVSDLLPMTEMKELLETKMATSNAFSDFVNFISQDRFMNFLKEVSKNEHYLEVQKLAVVIGVDKNSFEAYFQLFINIYAVLQNVF